MSSGFAVTPGVIDLIIGGVVLEFLVLAFVLARRGAGRLMLPFFLYLASGACLMLSLRASLANAAPPDAALPDAALPWVEIALLASLAAHLASLWRSVPLVPLVLPEAASHPVSGTRETTARRPA